MSKLFVVMVIIGLAHSAVIKIMLKPENIPGTPEKWTQIGKKVGLADDQVTAAVDLIKMVKDSNAEFETQEWQNLMLNKCKILAKDFEIMEIPDSTQITEEQILKWNDVKIMGMLTKMKFWEEILMKCDNEEVKIKALKNMCIVIAEDEEKKEIAEWVKQAGLKIEDTNAMADLMMKLKKAKTMEDEKAIMMDNCNALGNGGHIIEIPEQPRATRETAKNWNDVKELEMPAKLQFWQDKGKQTEDKVEKVKALKNMCIVIVDQKQQDVNEWAKMAGLTDDEIKTAVDLTMKLMSVKDNQMIRGMILATKCKELNKDNQITELSEESSWVMDYERRMNWNEVKDLDLPTKINFWQVKQNFIVGADKMKALKNLCIVSMQEVEENLNL